MSFIPKAVGTRMVPIPSAKIKVRKTTLFLLLNIVPRYEGKRNVIQQGAKRATMPPRNEAVSETPNSKLLFHMCFYRKRQFWIFGIIRLYIYIACNYP